MRKFLVYLLFIIPFFAKTQAFDTLKFTTVNTNNSYQIFAENNELVPMSASFIFSLINMKSSLNNDQIVVIPAESKKFLIATLSTVQQGKSYSFKYQSRYNFGDVTLQKFDENYIYDLPFEKGKSYLIYQGYNGNISHQNQFALDFSLKMGDKIYAAREGKVVQVIENNDKQCEKSECAKFNNKILVMHSDGTFAEYLHLKKDGAEINLGDEITKGQFLGYSGNTGWSTGPHLHFATFLNRMGGKREYIKTKFRTSNSTAELLEEKKSYLKNY